MRSKKSVSKLKFNTKAPRRIFDCFTFFNELDILEIRLEHLKEKVDVFVIAQGTYTHQGQEWKPLLNMNSPLISKYKSYAAFRMPIQNQAHSSPWEIEKAQRAVLDTSLFDVSNDDIIIVSDVDEIPNLEQLEVALEKNFLKHSLTMHTFFNYANTRNSFYWTHAKVVSGDNFTGSQNLREEVLLPKITPPGAHFSVIQGATRWKQKKENTPHTEMLSSISDYYLERCIDLNIYPSQSAIKLWSGARLKTIEFEKEIKRRGNEDSPLFTAYSLFPEYFTKVKEINYWDQLSLICALWLQSSPSGFKRRILRIKVSNRFIERMIDSLLYSFFLPLRIYSILYRKAKIRSRLERWFTYYI